MIIFDIDGVVADIAYFCAKDIAMCAGCKIEDVDMSQHSIKVTKGAYIPDMMIYHIATMATVKHVDEIQPYPGAIEFLLDYYQFNNSRPLTFLTARKGPKTEDATHKWLKKYLQFIPYHVIFEEDKVSFLEQNPRYTELVEDRLKTANAASDIANTFLVNRPWNVGRSTRDSVMRIDTLQDIWKYIEA